MNLIDFHKKFPYEDACIEYFKAKRELQGIICDKCDIHHDIQTVFLQSYLDEFCYKFNRRNLDVFERLITSCVEYKNEFKHRIYSKSA